MTWATTRRQLAGPYQLWATASASWHETLWPSDALLVCLAALIGATLFRRGSAVTLPLRPRVSPTAVAAHALPLGAWAVLGHAVGLLPLMASTARTATAGRLLAADVLIGVAGVLLLTTVGLALGAAARHWAIAPIGALLTFLVTALPNSPTMRPVALLQPVQQWTAVPRFVPSPWTTAFTVNACLVGGLAAIVLGGYALNRTSVSRGMALGWAVAPLLLVVLAFAWRPEISVAATSTSAACGRAAGARVCLHRAYARSLPAALRVTAVLQRAGTAPLLTEVRDVNLTDDNPTDIAVPRRGAVAVQIDVVPPASASETLTVEEMVAEQVTGLVFLGGCQGPGVPISTYDRQDAVRMQVLRLAGFGALVNRLGNTHDSRTVRTLAGMSPGELSRLIARRADSIRACRLTASDLGGRR
jgi:hypothetical protein